MRIQFCGADRTVTGSSHLIEVNGLRLFLDMGLYQGPRDVARRINRTSPPRLNRLMPSSSPMAIWIIAANSRCSEGGL